MVHGRGLYDHVGLRGVQQRERRWNERDSWGCHADAEHNRQGSLTQIAYPAYPTSRLVTFGYDDAGRVTGAQSGAKVYAAITGFLPHGAIQSMTMNGGKLTESATYNSRLQPFKMLTTGVGSATLLQLDYRYCANGSDTSLTTCASNNGNIRKQTITFPKATGGNFSETQDYGYDGVNRLQTAVAGGWTNSFAYDQTGNRWVTASPYALSSENPQNSGWYASDTNRVGAWFYDYMGNLLENSDGSRAMAYDAENRMVRATVSGSAETYKYDGNGRRVSRSVVKSSGSTEFTYVYDSSGQLASEYSTSVVPSPATMFLTADHLGSTRVVTDEAAAVVRRSDYLPFGEEVLDIIGGRSGLGYATDPLLPKVQPIGFTGKERDAETGLDYFGARYMSAAQGRFTSPDPKMFPDAVYDPQSWNKYGYVRNNPLRLVDPNGEDWKDVASGFMNAFNTNQVLGIGRTGGGNGDFRTGQAFGDAASTLQGVAEMLIGGGGEAGGIALDATGVGAIAGVPLNIASAGVIVHGTAVAGTGLGNLGITLYKNGTEGTYEFPDAKSPGKTYVGQSGNVENRLDQHTKSGKLAPGAEPKVAKVPGGKTAREVAEQKRINQLGGTTKQPGSQTSNERNPIGKRREKKVEDEYGPLKD